MTTKNLEALHKIVTTLIPRVTSKTPVEISKSDGDLAFMSYNVGVVERYETAKVKKDHLKDRNNSMDSVGELKLGMDARIIDGDPLLREQYMRISGLERTETGYLAKAPYTKDQPSKTKRNVKKSRYDVEVENLRGGWTLMTPEKFVENATEVFEKYKVKTVER